jgi:DNA invertase Pin-like site-specific DNA recombinase
MSQGILRTHLERRALVYLRQSTLRQVHEHRESTKRQYDLRQRAIDLGWTPDSVLVIDEDLGQSGTTTDRREGFRRLAEEVAGGGVGAIFALEPSRFARSSADWHRLLDLCGLTDVLIADEQGVYAPTDPNDRLLLGLKGQMSEAEQYWMRLRLQGGKLSKARRGALYMPPPLGYGWDPTTNRYRLDPDEQVQRLVHLVFDRFRIDGSARAVMLYLARTSVRVPMRRLGSTEPRWVPLRQEAVLAILHNPTYAGTYVYGRRVDRVVLVDGERRRRRSARVPQEAWKVCLAGHHPAYITWEQFMENQEKLRQNRSHHHEPDQRGAAREGAALLQGLVICGRCGQRMTVRYQSSGKGYMYECRSPGRVGLGSLCWSVSGSAIDDAVVQQFLHVAQPPEIELCFAVAREAERQAEELASQWKLRLERVRYDALLAERRYKAVDPDNRVVARTLERDWEEKLLEVERVEREFAEVRRRERIELDDADRARILAMARDLSRVWSARTTSVAHRKNLLRILVREVALAPIDVPERRTNAQILWVTGAVTERQIPRPNKAMAHATSQAAIERIRTLVAAGYSLATIASELNREGLLTGTGHEWSTQSVVGVKQRHGIQGPPPRRMAPDARTDGLVSVRGIAAHLGVTPAVVRHWVAAGLLEPVIPGGPGRPAWYRLDAATRKRLEHVMARGHRRASSLNLNE